MATLWLHKAHGCDFLVSFKSKVDAIEFSAKIFGTSEQEEDEDSLSYINKKRRDEALTTELTDEGIFISQLTDLQALILPDGYVPPNKNTTNTRYDKIAYVWPDDALAMLYAKKEPENFYNFPSGFSMVDREEPYNFTKYIPSHYELDEELEEYMNA